MRLRFWRRREPLPALEVDSAGDLGAVPIDRDAAVPESAPDAPSGYTDGSTLILEDRINAERSEFFPPPTEEPD
jgi:hypothetical protein